MAEFTTCTEKFVIMPEGAPCCPEPLRLSVVAIK